jgi:predicted sulfurtransferase
VHVVPGAWQSICFVFWGKRSTRPSVAERNASTCIAGKQANNCQQMLCHSSSCAAQPQLHGGLPAAVHPCHLQSYGG